MATLPNIADLSSYGGIKANYAPVEDPQTEWDAGDRNRMANDVAMMVPVANKAYVRFTTSATTPTLVDHNAQWGNGPSVVPVIARTGTGVFTITFPANVNDQLVGDPLNSANSSHALLIRAVHGSVEGNTFANTARFLVTSPNVLTVYTAASAVANDIAGSTVLVICL